MEQEVQHSVIEDGCLMRLLGSVTLQVVMGTDRHNVMQTYHKIYGHCGAHKLLQQILKAFWWPKINQVYATWVK